MKEKAGNEAEMSEKDKNAPTVLPLPADKIAAALGLNASAHPEGFAQFSELLASATFKPEDRTAFSAELDHGTLSDASLKTLKDKLAFDAVPVEKLPALNSFMGDVTPTALFAEPAPQKGTVLDLNVEAAAAEKAMPEIEPAVETVSSDVTAPAPKALVSAADAIEQIRAEALKDAEPLFKKSEVEVAKLEAIKQDVASLDEKMSKKKLITFASNLSGMVLGGLAAFFGTRNSGAVTRVLAGIGAVLGGGYIGGKLSGRSMKPLQLERETLAVEAQKIVETLNGIEANLIPIKQDLETRVGEVENAQEKLKEVIAEQTTTHVTSPGVDSVEVTDATQVKAENPPVQTPLTQTPAKPAVATESHTEKHQRTHGDGHSFAAAEIQRKQARPASMAQSA